MAPRLLCSDGPPIMTIPFSKPITVKPDTTVRELVRLMKEKDMSSAVVIDDTGRLLGVVTDRVLVEKIVFEEKPYNTKVMDIMIKDPLTGKASWSIAKALEAMAAIGVRHLVIVDDENKPIGILSLRDLVRHMIEDVDVQELPASD